MFLRSRKVPEAQSTYAALRAAAEEYLRRRWREIWDCRRQASAVAGAEVINAWGQFAAMERRLWDTAIKLGIPPETLRPAAGSSGEAERLLSASTPASHAEATETLVRALLIPGDAPLESLLTFCARMGKAFDRCRQVDVCEPQWAQLTMAPDPRVKAALVKFVCTPEGQPHAAAIVSYLLQQRYLGEHWPLTEADLAAWVACLPEDMLLEAIRSKAVATGPDTRAALKKLLFNTATSFALRRELVQHLALESDVARYVFESPQDPASQVLQLEAMSVYAMTRRRLPDTIDLMRFAGDAKTSPELRKAAAAVIGRLAGDASQPASGRALAWLKNASGADDQELAAIARKALSDSEQARLRERKLLDDDWRMRQEHYKKVIEDIEARLALPELVGADRAALEKQKEFLLFADTAYSISTVAEALRQYSDENRDALPASAVELADYMPSLVWQEAVYCPAGTSKKRDLPEDVIIAYTRRPVPSMDGGEPIVPLLFARLRQSSCSVSEFPTVWEASNQKRVKAGLAPLDLGTPETPDPRHMSPAWMVPATRRSDAP